jgi:hypothetical protein
VSWWLFWRDGYEALSAVDDDGDGWLRGSELDGIGVWCDTNEDGVCQPGEVKTLRELGIVGLACSGQASSRSDVVRWNPRGVVLAGGKARPTWDVLLRYTPPATGLALRRGASSR